MSHLEEAPTRALLMLKNTAGNLQNNSVWVRWLNHVSDLINPNICVKTSVSITGNHDAGIAPFIFADATGGAIVVTLPSPENPIMYNVKKTDASANAVTLDGGTNNIDGATTIAITTQYVSLTPYWDGTQWWIV